MKKTFTKLLTVIVLSLLTTVAMAQIFVDASKTGGANNGTSWTDAYIDLQTALINATSGSQIWVATGIYKPSVRPSIMTSSSITDRHFTFDIPEGVLLYGGFAGTETTISDRTFNPDGALVNITTLSGDIGVEGDDTDNAYHVVLIVERTGTIVLDGFTIQDGRGVISGNNSTTVRTVSVPDFYGGAIFVSNTAAVLKNLIVKNNRVARTNNNTGITVYGGAMYVRGGTGKTLDIEKAIFENNEASSLGTGGSAADPAVYGGALALVSGGLTATLADVEFKNNKITFATAIPTSAAAYGGAMHITSNVTMFMNNVDFEENTTMGTGGGGGAVSVLAAEATPSTLNIIGGKFERNEAGGHGGAMRVSTAAIINIDGTSFIGNEALTSYGGAIYALTVTSAVNVKNAKFFKNTASNAGGAFYRTAAGTFQFDNCLFAENKTTTSTGGAITVAGGIGTITGTTFYMNSATGSDGGGALRLTNTSGTVVNVYNSIMYANTNTHTSGANPDISKATNPTLTLKNIITQVYGIDGVDGVQVGAVPLFLSTVYDNTDFLKLAPVTGNPAIDAGGNSLIPVGITTDLTGVASSRIYNGTVDLGAYENHSVLPIKLTDFSAKANASSVVVNWVTETETNNSHFILEKSTDGVNFATIATPASKGNGAKYSYTDFLPANGTNYYRLTQVDNDGTKVTYNPIVVNFSLKAKNEVSIYPNPAVGGKVTVSLATNKFTSLQLVNLNGQKLQSLAISNSETEKTVDISAYPSGTYFILMSDGTNTVTKKVIKP